MALWGAIPVEIHRGFPGNVIKLKNMFRVIPGKMAKAQRDNSPNNELISMCLNILEIFTCKL